MPKHTDKYPAYRALLWLYPKAHREEFGEQMLQTLDDMLSDHTEASERIAVWLRIGRELPLNIVEEHINNLEEVSMNKALRSRRVGVGIGAGVVIIALAVSIGIALHRSNPYSPTTYAQLQRTSSRPVCLQKDTNKNLPVDSADTNYIGNVIATSITDAHAGTNVNVYFKTYSGSSATGTAAYSSYYGNYNYTVQKVASNSTNNFVGGWRVTRFEPCAI